MLLQGPEPNQCILTGLCGLQRAVETVPPGVMFAALGLLLLGLFGLHHSRRRRH